MASSLAMVTCNNEPMVAKQFIISRSVLIPPLLPRRGKRFSHFYDSTVCVLIKEMHITCFTCSYDSDKEMLKGQLCVYAHMQSKNLETVIPHL